MRILPMSLAASGAKVTVSVCDNPGLKLKVFGLTTKTRGADVASVESVALPIKFPRPAFFILKVLVADKPIPTLPVFTTLGATIFAPFATGVGVAVAV
jgi:hypothetical protein